MKTLFFLSYFVSVCAVVVYVSLIWLLYESLHHSNWWRAFTFRNKKLYSFYFLLVENIISWLMCAIKANMYVFAPRAFKAGSNTVQRETFCMLLPWQWVCDVAMHANVPGEIHLNLHISFSSFPKTFGSAYTHAFESNSIIFSLRMGEEVFGRFSAAQIRRLFKRKSL